MKTLIAALISGLALSAQAQIPSSQSLGVSTGTTGAYTVVERGPNHRVWQRTVVTTNAAGVMVTNVGSYVELNNGLHYRDSVSGQYVESQELIESVPGGAVARHGQHQVIFANDIASAGAIDMLAPDGKRFTSHILGLSYFDASTGTNVLIAELTNSLGVIASPNTILYRNAFDDIRATVRYTYTRGGFEQDVILQQVPPPPEAFGLNAASTRLLCMTEFINPAEPAQQTTTTADDAGFPISDSALDFGSMQIGAGTAFALGTNGSGPAIKVYKEWTTISGRHFLIEEVPVPALLKAISALPTGMGASVAPSGKGKRMLASVLERAPSRRAGAGDTNTMRLAQGRLPIEGLVLDYQTMVTSNNFTFAGDTTYYISGPVTLSGTTRCEPGTVLKFCPTNNAQLSVNGTIVTLGAMYRPVIFTARDDNSLGEGISGSSGVPTNFYGSMLVLANASTLNDCRFLFGNKAITINGNLTATNIQFIRCATPISCNNDTLTIKLFNGLLWSNNIVFDAGHDHVFNGQHLTVNQAGTFFTASGAANAAINLTNCLVIGITNWGKNIDSLGTNRVPRLTSSAGIFQPTGAGYAYLATNSPYQGAGTTTIDQGLAAALKLHTTYPPVLLTNNFSSNTNLAPVVSRNTGVPDIGYLYDPVDYAISGVTITNTVVLTNGVAVAVFGTNGIKLGSGAKVISAGAPGNLNHLFRYNLVQEQPTAWGGTNNIMSLMSVPATYSSWPEVRLRFTDVSVLANSSNKRYLLNNGFSCMLSNVVLQDCQMWGATMDIEFYNSSVSPLRLALTNNLMHRAYLYVYQEGAGTDGMTAQAWNNLFRGGSVTWANYDYTTTWGAYDNLFDSVQLSAYDGHSGRNGYVSGFNIIGGGTGGDITLTNKPSYQVSYLGSFYYPTNDGMLSKLIDTGSRNATNAGLFHYTTTTNQVEESTTTVDIGFHYPAVNVPVIISQPQSLTVTQGANANFSVIVTNTLVLNYQWTFNGTNIAGATGSTYAIASTQWSNSGNYAVIISNQAGSVTSSNAMLTVLSLPSILIQPVSATVLQGGATNFSVTAVGTWPLWYQWKFNGTNLHRGTATSYTLASAQPQHAGTYSVTISNIMGVVTSSNAALTVLALPVITTQPAGGAGCPGGSVLFTVSASGSAPLAYQWRKGGTNIGGATTSSFMLASLVASNAASYSVVVTNLAGSVLSSNAVLYVGQGLPGLTLNPQANGTGCVLYLDSAQATQFISTVFHTTNANAHPYSKTVVATVTNGYADSIFGRMNGCSDSISLGINLGKLPPPIIQPTNGYFNYPSNVTITLGLENLTNMVKGLYMTELGRTGTTTEVSATLATAQGLRNAGYSDEDVRTNLINGITFRNSAEYISLFGAPGSPYQRDTNYLIEYSIDGGTNWSAYTGPIPIAETVTLQARAFKTGSTDARTAYSSLGSDVVQTSFMYIPASWMIQYWGTNYVNVANTGPTNDFNTDGISNLQEYLNGTDPTTNSGGFAGPFDRVVSPQDLISIQFSATGNQGSGPAVVGFNQSDFWNSYSPGSATTAFSTGMALQDASSTAVSNALFWSFVGPYWPDWRWGYPTCVGYPFDRDWHGYWGCWKIWFCSIEHIAAFCRNMQSPPYWVSSGWCGLYDYLAVPDWWYLYGWRLPEYWRMPVWLPGFDEEYVFNNLPANGLLAMGTDGLTSISQNELYYWLAYCGFDYYWWYDYYWGWGWPHYQQAAPAHVYITGLNPGLYQVYLYGPSTATVNGLSGVRSSWRTDSAGISIPYTRYTTAIGTPGLVPVSTVEPPSILGPIGGGRLMPHNLNWTNEPLWLPKATSRLEIHFQDIATIAGMQIARVNPAAGGLATPAPNAWPGRGSVYLAWPPVNAASGYQVYRAVAGSTNYTLVASTANPFLSDTHLAKATTYYYSVIATNDYEISAASSPATPALTLGDIPVIPGGGGVTNPPLVYTNGAPVLTSIKPVQVPNLNGVFQVPFVKVLAASDAWDPNGDPLSFKVDAVFNGTLQINTYPFDAVTNCTFDSHATVVWAPYPQVPDSGLDAFTVRAFDGVLRSATNAVVTIVPVPQTYLVGWGRAYDGAMGDGVMVHDRYDLSPAGIKISPTRVHLSNDLVKVVHRYAMGAAATADGSLMMWGNDYGMGAFGEGKPSTWDQDTNGVYLYNTFIGFPTPFQVQMFGADGHTLQNFTNVADVAVGYNTMFALRTDGTLWSWGEGDFNSLGRDVPYTNYIPATVGWIPCTKKAGQITGFVNVSGQNLSVIQLAADDYGGLALCEDGSVWWWGTIDLWRANLSPVHGIYSEDDFLDAPQYLTSDGNPTTVPVRLPAFDSGARVTQLAAGGGHLAALRSDGTVWEFGYVPRLGFFGTLTNHNDCNCPYSYCNFSATPVQVTNLPSNIVSVRVHEDYALALSADGQVYAWGSLPNPDNSALNFASPTPVPISGMTNIAQIELSSLLALARDKAGNVWGWEYNYYGALERDRQSFGDFSPTPVLIFGVQNAQDIVAGDYTGFAVGSLETGRPIGLTATPMNHSVRLNWQTYPGASSYNVYRGTNASDTGVVIGQAALNTYTDSGLVNGSNYVYAVTAMVGGVETPQSDKVIVAPIDPPVQPTWSDPASGTPPVVATCSSVHLAWNQVTNAQAYKVYRSASGSGGFTYLAQTGGLNFVDQTACAGITYYYQIFATSTAGDSIPSVSSPPVVLNTAICPTAPYITGLSVPGDGQVTITWTQTTATAWSVLPDSYRIKWYYGRKDPTSTNTYFTWRDITSSDWGFNGTEYNYTLDSNNASLEADLSIWCKVAAVTNGEAGPDSNLAGPVLLCSQCATNTAPQGLFAVPGYQQVYLQWQDSSVASWYEVWWRTNCPFNTSNNWQIVTSQILESRFWHTNLINGTNYQYQVRYGYPVYDQTSNVAVIAYSPFSTNAVATPLASLQGPAVAFTAKADAYDNMVYVHWESLTNQPPLLCFVERKPTSGGSFNTITDTGYGLAYLDQDVVNGTLYTYRVTALDTNYNLHQSSVNAMPTNSGFLNLIAVPGNGYVTLTWGLTNAAQFQVKHSLNANGPFDILTTVVGGNSYQHVGIQNGVTHYYVVTAIMPYNVSFNSPPVGAMPLGTLAPLPPQDFQGQLGLDTNGNPQVLLTWSPSAGAVRYGIVSPSYMGTATSVMFPVPGGTTNGQVLTYVLNAFSSIGAASASESTSVTYLATTNGPANQIILSIGSHDVLSDADQMTITGPTNLVLKASVPAQDASDAIVYFYDLLNGTVIGSAHAPEAQVTWFHVPQGIHLIMAQAVSQGTSTSIPGMGASSGATYNSAKCTLTVNMLPDLASYQAASTDLQLPAPGLPIVVSRTYDSRGTNASGFLGLGWSAGWESCLKVSAPLDSGWVEAGISGLGQDHYNIADTNSHVVTLTLPGGNSIPFAAQVITQPNEYPLDWLGGVSLVFNNYSGGQETLTCTGNQSPSHLDLAELNATGGWLGSPLQLIINPDDMGGVTPFIPYSFTYTAQDGTQYLFTQVGTNAQPPWKLVQIIDRNGNSLSYTYDTNSLNVTKIAHSNGRQVQFDYQPGTINGGAAIGTWLNVYDTSGPLGTGAPVFKYFVQTNVPIPLLLEVDKMVVRTGSTGTYETNTYAYGSTGFAADQGRLTDVYDARGVRVVHNQYGTNSSGVMDGRLIIQVDALSHTNSYGLDNNNALLTVTTKVNGTNQVITVNHDASGAIGSVQSGYQSVTNTYDSRGRLIAQTDAYGNVKTISYDSFDRPINQTDPLGNSSSTSLDDYGNPLTATDANGNTSSFSYDSNGNLVLSTDAAGLRTDTGYAAPITMLVGGVTNISAAGMVGSEIKSGPGLSYQILTSYGYYNTGSTTANLNGELQSVVQGWAVGGAYQGLTVTNLYEYDANGNRTKETHYGTVNGSAGTAVVTKSVYDAQNRLIQTIDALNRTNVIVYNKLGKQAATIDALNRTNLYTYDPLGNLIETQYPDGSVTRSTYDELNRVVFSQERCVTNPSAQSIGPATINVYDSAGKVVRVERHSGVVLTKQTISAAMSPSGGDTQYTVVASGSGTLVSQTRTIYDLNGRVQYSVDAHGAVTQSIYDAAGRRITNVVYTAYSVDPLSPSAAVSPSGASNVTAYVYDPNSNQIAVIDALGHETDYDYDAVNRQVRVRFPIVSGESVQKSQSTTYDALGRKRQQTDEAGVITAFSYDFRGLLKTVTLDYGTPNSIATSYDYDAAGLETSQIDANGHTTQFQYDALGRRTKRILPDGTATETTAYADVPETVGSTIKVSQTAVTDFRGKTITNTLDRVDRSATRFLPAINSGETSTTVAYTYGTNNLVSRVDMYGYVNRTNYYTYDDLRRMVQKDTPEGVLAYTYVATNNNTLTSIKGYRRSAVPVNGAIGGATPDVNLGYAYDVLSRLQTVTNNTVAAPNATVYQYDAVGNLASFQYPNGLKHAYTYTAQNRLAALALTQTNGSLLRSYSYSLDRAGHRTGLIETNLSSLYRSVSYGYDTDASGNPTLPRVYRLTSESLAYLASGFQGSIVHLYDTTGNRTNRSASLNFTPSDSSLTTPQAYSFDTRDQVVGSTVDGNGNTVTPSGGATTDYYDAENHLVKRGTTIRVGYDYEGNRVWKSVNGVTNYYLLDDRNPSGYAQVLAEYGSLANQPDRGYAYGLELINQVVYHSTFNLTASTNYYGYDGQGSVRVLLDGTLPASITDTYDYDAYGQMMTNWVTTTNNYRYTGQQWDFDLGMYVLRARYYQPNLGRFWTMDSYEGSQADPLSLHKYLYCNGNPANLVDPSGHDGSLPELNVVTLFAVSINAWSAAANIRAGRYGWAAVDILSMGLGIGGMIGPGALPQMASVANFGRGVSFAAWAAALRGAQNVSKAMAAVDLLMMAMSGTSSGSSESGGDVGDTYPNRYPSEYAREAAAARAVGVEPTTVTSLDQLNSLLNQTSVLKWVVTLDNKLRVVPFRVSRVEISHAVAAEGRAVRAAGEARIRGGVLELNRRSGHYWPQTWTPGELKFRELGLPVKLIPDSAGSFVR